MTGSNCLEKLPQISWLADGISKLPTNSSWVIPIPESSMTNFLPRSWKSGTSLSLLFVLSLSLSLMCSAPSSHCGPVISPSSRPLVLVHAECDLKPWNLCPCGSLCQPDSSQSYMVKNSEESLEMDQLPESDTRSDCGCFHPKRKFVSHAEALCLRLPRGVCIIHLLHCLSCLPENKRHCFAH